MREPPGISRTQFSAGAGLALAGSAFAVQTPGTAGNIFINGLNEVDINGALAVAKGGTNATSFTADRLIAFNAGGTAFETTTLQPSLIVETTGAQTLTNKTMDSASNDITANALWDRSGGKVDIVNTPNALGVSLRVTSLVPLEVEWSLAPETVDIDGLTESVAPLNADSLVIYDSTLGLNRKVTRGNLLAGVTASLPSGVSIVAGANGDFTSITAAIAAAVHTRKAW